MAAGEVVADAETDRAAGSSPPRQIIKLSFPARDVKYISHHRGVRRRVARGVQARVRPPPGWPIIYPPPCSFQVNFFFGPRFEV